MSRQLTIALGAVLALYAWGPASAGIRVHVIDVGQAASSIVEFDHAAILIDAGGEDTNDNRDAKSISDALTALFARRTDLHNSLEAVIVSHPHMDHTMNLMTVMKGFTVRRLVDNGDTNEKASGMAALKAARAFASTNNIPYVPVEDKDIPADGRVLELSPEAESGARVTLLSGFRGCADENNDSIAVLIKDGNASVLFAGDAESEDKSGACRIEPQLQHLVNRFGPAGLLEAKVYLATHHGSRNGVLPSMMERVHPVVSVISAGRLAQENRRPGEFHAFQFGHPRKEAIDSLVANTSGARPAKQVSYMTEDGMHHPDATPATVLMEKAVFCTCWDGNIDIAFTADGEPLVAPATPPPPSCNVAPADISVPAVKAPDYVNDKPADYYMLSLSWSPQFCTTGAGKSPANKFQCQENSFGMVVHGLWPQSSAATNDRQHPRNCKTTTPIAAETLRQHMCTVPGVQLQQDEWAKHGTCAFGTPEEYLSAIEKLRSELNVPDLQALAAAKGSNLRASDVIDAFHSANPDLPAPGVQLLLGGKNLQEVHVCYGMDLKYRKCDTTSKVAATAKVKIRPVSH
jgi:ribonuclease T2